MNITAGCSIRWRNRPGRPRVAGREFLGLGRRRPRGGAEGFRRHPLGDPPCEPQGLNSVFNTDKGTLDVIAAANQKLAGMA